MEWGAESPPPLSKICFTYLIIMKFGTYTLPKEDPKNIWIMWHTLWVLLTQHCLTRNQQILLYQETQIQISFWHTWVFKTVLITLVVILMMSAKITTSGLLKITVFWNKGYGVIIHIHEVINKTLSRDSNYIVDVFMWPKIGNSSISMKEVITTSTF